MKYEFFHGNDLLEISRKEQIPVSEIMILREMERSRQSREHIWEELKSSLQVMKRSISRGLDAKSSNHGKLCGQEAIKLLRFSGQSNLGEHMSRVIASSMAVAEYNVAMGKIVAAPTAGASGILPAVLIVCGNGEGFLMTRYAVDY